MTWSSIVTTIILVLFGAYEIGHGYRQSRRYNLHFLLIGGLLTGWPFLTAGVILLLGLGSTLGSLKYLLLAGWACGALWETWQRRKYYQANPDEDNELAQRKV
jgi:hypothetical protein